MARLKTKKAERKSPPRPLGRMYDNRLISDWVKECGGYRAAGKLVGVSGITVRSAARGGNIRMATFWAIAYAMQVSGCRLLGEP